MLRNYILITLRSLLKQRVYTAINVLGLATGIASCLAILLFVQDEFSYDKFHSKANQIYKIGLERKYPNHSTFFSIIPHSYAEVIPKDFPEVEEAVRLSGPFNNTVVTYRGPGDDQKQFEEDFVMAADSNFFHVFSIRVLKGDPDKALTKLSDIVLTETTARKYFGSDDPIGKTLRMFNQDFVVTAVCEDVPENSHMKFDFLGKWDAQFFGGGLVTNFVTFSAHVYLVLKPGSDPSALEAKFPAMVDRYAAAQIERDFGKAWQDYKKEGNGYRFFLQSLTSVHLDPTNFEAKMQPGGNRSYVYFLIGIAILILVIACINFMNLATARSAARAREVGLRKTLGSLKTQLVFQFLTESVVLALVSSVVGMAMLFFVLPYFNDLTSKSLEINFSFEVIAALLVVVLIVGFMAGSYPAFVLSALNPVIVLKGKFTGNARGAWLRNSLVVFQFFISIVLIVGTIVIYKQMQYMQVRSLGYDKEQMLIVERLFALNGVEQQQTFVNELGSLPDVESAASAFSMLGRQNDFFGAQYTPEGSSEILTTKSMAIDDDFAHAVGFQFVDGKGYSKATDDSLSIILNESAVRVLGIDNPVGKKLSQLRRNPDGTNAVVQLTIIGVIKDFNFQSLRDPITPLTIQSNETFGGGATYAYVRIKGKNIPSVLAAVEAKWKLLAPDQPFKYAFLDRELTAQYESEDRAGKVFAIFSGLAIIVACVGLFGLAAYTASLRTKEIGVRKVLGASVTGVVLLLSKEFTRLVLIAFLLAAPIGWYVMDTWLQGFAYRIELGAGIFLLAGVIALLISWATVSYQSVKAAIANPIRSLRSE
jgi:putative ABC transport system permease protein